MLAKRMEARRYPGAQTGPQVTPTNDFVMTHSPLILAQQRLASINPKYASAIYTRDMRLNPKKYVELLKPANPAEARQVEVETATKKVKEAIETRGKKDKVDTAMDELAEKVSSGPMKTDDVVKALSVLKV